MTKLDFKKTDKALYGAKHGVWGRVDVPDLPFLMIDGRGDPEGPGYARALGGLYPIAYGVKFAMKGAGADFAVPPLEALWWADDPGAFVTADRENWQWRAMIRMPDAVNQSLFSAVLETVLTKQAKKKDGADPDLLRAVRFESYHEGDSLQTLHIGPYTDETPVLANLHDKVMPEAGLTFGGYHHEIYLSDPRRVAPEKLKTILRQPVRPI